jgi:hypothetical protein
MRYIFYGIVIAFAACTGQTREEQNPEERTPARRIEIILTRDGKPVSNPEVEISFVKVAGDTTRITSADEFLEAPPYDSALRFYRVRYGKFKADMIGPFLNMEFSGMITPEIRKWWIDIARRHFPGGKVIMTPPRSPTCSVSTWMRRDCLE